MLEQVFVSLRDAQSHLAQAGTEEKDAALKGAAEALRDAQREILGANLADVAEARRRGMKAALIDRLSLDETRLAGIAAGIEAVRAQDDPINQVRSSRTLPNGLRIEEVVVPLGVAAVIYESRPNVTADVFALGYKAGCGVLLRGSASALHSNTAMLKAIQHGVAAAGGIAEAVALTSAENHQDVDEILAARGYIDVVLPRGGRDLIRHVVENARVPVIETGEGNCHIYVHQDADILSAVDIVENAKVQKPGACNAVETVLVHQERAPMFLPCLGARLGARVIFRCDQVARKYFGTSIKGLVLEEASEADWATEFLDYTLAVKVVASLDEAVRHISRYGTKHSEAILTQDADAAATFCRQVDAACVYVNASTRFTDGGVFGLGAELGISTQKFHVRGPMGIKALTSIKYRITGHGQVRPD